MKSGLIKRRFQKDLKLYIHLAQPCFSARHFSELAPSSYPRGCPSARRGESEGRRKPYLRNVIGRLSV